MHTLQITAKTDQYDSLLDVASTRTIEHGRQARLACGVIINIYETGTVMVQGKLLPQNRDESLRLLKQALPPNTRWCLQ